MRNLRSALLAGAAAAAIGFSGAALAQSSDSHVMTVRLPDGGVAQIRYTGTVAPRVSFSDRPSAIEALAPMPLLFGPGSPFAALDRISAEMDRQAAALFRQTDALTASAGPLDAAALRNLPSGSQSYSFVSTLSGSGVCSESVQITAQGNGAPPRVVRHRSGNCGSIAGGTGAVSLPTAPTPPTRPDVVWTSASGAHPYAGLVHEIPAAAR